MATNANHKPTGTVGYFGKLVAGEILQAYHTLADADGIGSVQYQWRADGFEILGAVGSKYLLTREDIGKKITVSCRYIDGLYKTEVVIQDSPLQTSSALYQAGNWVSGSAFYDVNGQRYIKDNPALVMQSGQIDLNADGLLDVFTFDSYSLDAPTPNPPPSIFINNGVTLNKVQWNGPTLGNPHGVKVLVGDFNGDGVEDLFSLVAVDPPFGAFPDLLDYNNLILWGETPELVEFKDWRGFWYAGASGDIDNDGDLDLIIFNFHVFANGVQNRILWNDGTGKFTDTCEGIGSLQIDQAELVDVDHDGYLDLIVDQLNVPRRQLQIFWGNGKGFGEYVGFIAELPSDLFVSNLLTADIDGDGLDEIFISAVDSQGVYQFKAYRSSDHGKTVTEVTDQLFDNPIAESRFDHSRLFDIDHDGLLDIFATDKDATIRWEWDGSKFSRVSETIGSAPVFLKVTSQLIASNGVNLSVSLKSAINNKYQTSGVWFESISAKLTYKDSIVILGGVVDDDGVEDGQIQVNPIKVSPDRADASITLTDVLGALKVYLNKPLDATYDNPYKYVAADFEGDGDVDLSDVLSLLKYYLNKPTTTSPKWVFVDKGNTLGESPASAIQGQALSKITALPAPIVVDVRDNADIELVGILRGDVDCSWTPT